MSAAPHERVVVVNPPPDCDFSGVWLVLDERRLPDGDSHLRLQQGNSYIGARRSNVRAATQADIDAGRSPAQDAAHEATSAAGEALEQAARAFGRHSGPESTPRERALFGQDLRAAAMRYARSYYAEARAYGLIPNVAEGHR